MQQTKFIFVLLELDNCLGDLSIVDGICPNFNCTGPSSCSNRGNCSSYVKSCDCEAGFSGFDCSVDLEGDSFNLSFLFLS